MDVDDNYLNNHKVGVAKGILTTLIISMHHSMMILFTATAMMWRIPIIPSR